MHRVQEIVSSSSSVSRQQQTGWKGVLAAQTVQFLGSLL